MEHKNMKQITTTDFGKISDTKIVEKLEQYAHAARGAYADNTLKAIRRDTERFSSWCQVQGVPSIPASATVLAKYVDDCSENKLKPSTISRFLSSISHVHRAAEINDPTKDNIVKLSMKRIRRGGGGGGGTSQKQAVGLTESHVAAALAVSKSQDPVVKGVRDRAILLVSRDLMLRSSELVALDFEDVAINDNGSATVLIKRSKTDQEGGGCTLWASSSTVEALKHWFEVSSTKKGPLFRSLHRSGKVKDHRLSTTDHYRIMRNLGNNADIGGVSGHSPRVGMAQDLVEKGADVAGVMQAGRWKSPSMLAKYSSKILAGRGAVAQYYQKK